uniref:Uncharacterized protein n=1 Tax=Trichogramma kaykai TaxID=54128 RepID=A0ABD2VVI7_9HYME
MSSRKRSLSPAREMEKLMKKVKKLEERVQAASARLQNKDSLADESSPEHRDPDPSDSSSPVDDSSEKKEEEKVEKKEEEVETEDEEWAEIIGENPKNSGAQITTVKSDLLEIWKFFCTEGMKKEAEEALIAKYVCREEFNAPTLNPQIASIMKESSKTRDRYMATIQKLAGLSLLVIGSIMTNIYDHRDEGVNIIDILTPLKDAGDLLSLIINKQSKNRKAFIEPGLAKESSAILKETSIDEFLYGKDLSGKIKEMKAFSKEADVNVRGLQIHEDVRNKSYTSEAVNSTTKNLSTAEHRPREAEAVRRARQREISSRWQIEILCKQVVGDHG